MRVIAGSARRITLNVADKSQTRPFLEMARGALFNSLGDNIIDTNILDLYAGSGALGIEALSRGAESCVFVEKDRKVIKVLEENLARCKLSEQAKIISQAVEMATMSIGREFDYIFLDPPFADAEKWSQEIPDGIKRNCGSLLKPAGKLFLRFEHRRAEAPELDGLKISADRRYGRSRVVCYNHDA